MAGLNLLGLLDVVAQSHWQALDLYNTAPETVLTSGRRMHVTRVSMPISPTCLRWPFKSLQIIVCRGAIYCRLRLNSASCLYKWFNQRLSRRLAILVAVYLKHQIMVSLAAIGAAGYSARRLHICRPEHHLHDFQRWTLAICGRLPRRRSFSGWQ